MHATRNAQPRRASPNGPLRSTNPVITMRHSRNTRRQSLAPIASRIHRNSAKAPSPHQNPYTVNSATNATRIRAGTVVARQQRSGETIRQFCRQHAVNESSFHFWRGRTRSPRLLCHEAECPIRRRVCARPSHGDLAHRSRAPVSARRSRTAG